MLKKKITRFLNSDGSFSVTDPEVIKSFTDDPGFPYLVSFSRTGSHWLRMVMELYFDKPALVRAFYNREAMDFTCYHTHDMDLKLRRENVIYLYRNPIETVYSQLCYYKESLDDEERRRHWSTLYARHLSKWLVRNDFTQKKTVITYEGMKSDMHGEIRKISAHFDKEFYPAKLDSVLARVSKEELKKKTKHDQQVVNLTDAYRNEREIFREKYGKLIMKDVYSTDRGLENLF